MEDAVTAASKNYKVLLENDRVRVLEYRDTPSNKTTMHSHPALVVYPISGGSFKFTSPDGESVVFHIKAGQPLYMDSVEHSTENVGTTDGHVLLVELK